VSWNGTGTRLISGSDDCHLNIYDAGTGLVGHVTFSLLFIPRQKTGREVLIRSIGLDGLAKFMRS